jgi:hypothetical protein
LDAAGYAKYIIQMNPITNTNSSTLLVFFILVCNCLLGILLKEAVDLGAW